MIIATAGTFNAGKGIGGEYLEERFNLLRVVTGDMVRAVSRELHGNVERHNLITTAHDLRKERGPGVLAELAIEEYRDKQDQYGGVIIDGIRSIGEAEEVLKAEGKIIFVDAPKAIRWERAKKRSRDGEEPTVAQFTKNEEIELHGDGDDKTVINLLAIKQLADVTIINDNDLGQYFANLESYINSLA